MKEEEMEITGSEARQKVILRQGIETPLAKELVGIPGAVQFQPVSDRGKLTETRGLTQTT